MNRRAAQHSIAMSLAAIGLLASCAQIRDLPELRRRDLRLRLTPQTSSIFAADGDLLTTLHGEKNRTVVGIGRIPRRVLRAVVAIEDERFFEHRGVDLKAVVRAAVENVTSGEVRQGGSTITQQYVKNVIISPNAPAAKTLQRKIDEAALARQLEHRLTKRQILERYLNTVYFGKGAYGVQAAAKTYFGKPVWKLSLKEAALLAGVIQLPSAYDPFDLPGKATRRRNVVLSKMVEVGWASPRRAHRAARAPLGLKRPYRRPRYPAPYFVDYVKRLLTFDPRFELLGKTIKQRTKRLLEGGLKIYTTVDLETQRAAEAAARRVLPYAGDPHAAIVAIDPRLGYVRAMVGGRDFFAPQSNDRFAKVNLAIPSEPDLGRMTIGGREQRRAPGTGRQAGSAFKTFALAAAIEQGVPLTKRYLARPCMTFPKANNGKPWEVCNYEEAAYGKIPLSEATTKSVNVVYAQLILEIGPPAVARMARAMGINTDLAAVPSAVLGANPVNALGMASAYSTLATGGIHRDPVAITRIVDTISDKVIYRDKTQAERVMDPAVAYLTTSALQRVMSEGTGTGAQIGRPAAGKTGTAQEYRDAWFAGFTPNLAAAVWIGYPRASIEMKTYCDTPNRLACRPTRIQVTGGSWPAEIWRTFMLRVLAGVPALDFQRPEEDLVTVFIDTEKMCLAADYTPSERVAPTTFLEGTEPKRVCPPPPPPPEPVAPVEPDANADEDGSGGGDGDQRRADEGQAGPGNSGGRGADKGNGKGRGGGRD